MVEEYCHVKTTPDMPIRLAVRMSMSIPGDVIIFDCYIYRMTNLINDSAKSNSSICLNGQNKLKNRCFFFFTFFPQKLHGSKTYLSIARWQHASVISSPSTLILFKPLTGFLLFKECSKQQNTHKTEKQIHTLMVD